MPESIYYLLTSIIAFPIWAGDKVTSTPASLSACIFSVAPPFPPAMIAPACPILLPGGAVRPAINDATGFLLGPWKRIEVLKIL